MRFFKSCIYVLVLGAFLAMTAGETWAQGCSDLSRKERILCQDKIRSLNAFVANCSESPEAAGCTLYERLSNNGERAPSELTDIERDALYMKIDKSNQRTNGGRVPLELGDAGVYSNDLTKLSQSEADISETPAFWDPSQGSANSFERTQTAYGGSDSRYIPQEEDFGEDSG